jgi:hypothetical protein
VNNVGEGISTGRRGALVRAMPEANILIAQPPCRCSHSAFASQAWKLW